MLKKINILFNTQQKWLLVLSFILSLITIFFEFLGISSIPIFVSILIDDSNFVFFDKIDLSFLNLIEKEKLIFFSTITLLTIFIVKNIYLIFFTYFQAYLQKTLRADLMRKIFNYYIHCDYSFYLKTNSSTLIRNLGSEVSQTITFVINFLNLFKEILVLLMIFSLVLYVNPTIALIIFLAMLSLVLIYFMFTKNIIVNNAKIIQKIRGLQLQHMTQSFNTIKEIKVFGKEKFINNLFSKHINIFEKSIIINSILSTIPRIIIETFVTLGIIGIVFFYISTGKSFTDLITLLSLLAVSSVRLIPSFSTVSKCLSGMKNLLPSLQLITREIITHNINYQIKKEPTINKNFGKIEFKNVSFAYDGADQNSLSDLNFEINSGDKIGIIGKSGSGKSTLINLLIGLIENAKGQILIDKLNIKKIPKSWLSQISYVPQDIYLLDDSIKNNIAFGEDENLIKVDKLKNVINISQLDEVVSKLKEKEDTYVGDKGVRFSGGQKQRIGIARSLYFNRNLLILDEATNSIDPDNEKKIISNIIDFYPKKTIICISHNHETIKNFDKVIYLQEGKVSEIGKYEDLNSKFNFDNIFN